MDSNNFHIACYEHEVPSFVGPEMDRLYGNVFSSLSHIEMSDEARRGVSTYVVRSGGRVVTIILFLKEGNRARVLNEVVRISSDEIRMFSRYVFTSYGDVALISFKAIETDIKKANYPLQRFNYSEDIAMKIPSTPQEYLSSLGKNTRRNIKRYSDRLKRDFPSVEFKVYVKDEVAEHQIRNIVALNRERMASKNKTSILDEKETRHIIRNAQTSGLVGIMTINEKICAGAISYCVGDNYFLDVLAHDLSYNDYWIGILCCYMTICECITRGGKEFHFLWGRYDYKFTLGAALRDLDNVVVYRSPLHMLLNVNVALKMTFDGYLRRLKLWMSSDKGFLPKLLRNGISTLKRFKRMDSAPLATEKSPSAAMHRSQSVPTGQDM